MKKTFQMSMFLVVALSLALPGQRSDAPDKLAGVKTKAEIDTLVAKIRGGELKGAQPLFEREKGPYRIYTSFIENRKGAADLHGTDDEVFLIVSGAAEVTLGGDISDKKSTAANEFRGTTIVGGITLERMIQELNGYTRGWMGYFRIAETPTVLSDLDCWIRRRLRSAVAKQWFKSCKARFRGLNGLGVDPKQAAITAVTRRGPWAMSNMKAFKLAMPNKFFAERGLLTLSGYVC